ncbi:hypothetical protein QTO34_012076 [Cnephaeus nilssonii]|uniref:Uncharacterized protein n=1 Tax=Cnephaeus nilssonii TaxID=3371016 RepID=A0AA40HC47_CNENI|nr:hypothetical protein QTO34_012076 [Eptesicus nilssonii]
MDAEAEPKDAVSKASIGHEPTFNEEASGGRNSNKAAWVSGSSSGSAAGATCGCLPAGLRHMSGSELTELLDQVEGAIRDFSEELVQQLARRDELEFEKEVKNSFITVLIEVQNKQKEQRELMKKRRKEKGLSLQSGRVDKGSQMPLKRTRVYLEETRCEQEKITEYVLLVKTLESGRFSMEGISSILQSSIRQTFGSSGTDKQTLATCLPSREGSGGSMGSSRHSGKGGPHFLPSGGGRACLCKGEQFLELQDVEKT